MDRNRPKWTQNLDNFQRGSFLFGLMNEKKSQEFTQNKTKFTTIMFVHPSQLDNLTCPSVITIHTNQTIQELN